MMRCLYCGKTIEASASDEEKKNLWHSKCVKAFFKTDEMPEINVSKKELEALTIETVSKGLTVPGVQKKLSLHLSKTDDRPRLTIVDYPTGYILKPQSEGYAALPEAEAFAMKLAEKCGIKTVPNALVKLQRQKGAPLAYITKRVDRVTNPDGTEMYAMEDCCQLGLRLTRDKYKSSYEKVGKIVSENSYNPGTDMAELYTRLIFCFLIGNSDMHLKNFSLIEDRPGSRKFSLSPAYDLLPVNVIVPEDQEEMALSLNGKKRNITRNDFLKYAEGQGISSAAAKKMMDNLLDMKLTMVEYLEKSYMPEDMKEKEKELIEARFARLGRGL